MSEYIPEFELEIKDLSDDLQKIFKKEYRKLIKKDLNKIQKQFWKTARAMAPKGPDSIPPTWRVYTEQRNSYGRLSKDIRILRGRKQGVKPLSRSQKKLGYHYKSIIGTKTAFWINFLGGTKNRQTTGKGRVGLYVKKLKQKLNSYIIKQRGTGLSAKSNAPYKRFSKKANRGSIPQDKYLNRVWRLTHNQSLLEKKMVQRSMQAFAKALEQAHYKRLKGGV